MNSWDVFDTLLTRRVLDPREVPCPRADQLFPIHENVSRVQPGDLLISDMAEMTPDAVTGLVREVTGLQNRVIVTRDGKATGRIWKELVGAGLVPALGGHKGRPYEIGGAPLLHTGDNLQSDVNQPRAHGIEAELYSGSQLSKAEQEILDAGHTRLAMAMREGRLRTFDPVHRELELTQTQINFPLLYLAALALRPYLQDKRVLAASRDCWLWKDLLREVAKCDAVYWWSSRLARAFPTAEYLEYTEKLLFPNPESQILNPVLLDLVGTGWSLRRLRERLHVRPLAMWMLAFCGEAMNQHYEQLRATTGDEAVWLIASASQGLEHNNTAPHPMMRDVNGSGPVYFNPTDYSWGGSPEIRASHAAFKAAFAALSHYPETVAALSSASQFKSDGETPPLQKLLLKLAERLPEAAWLPREDPYVQEELRRLADAAR